MVLKFSLMMLTSPDFTSRWSVATSLKTPTQSVVAKLISIIHYGETQILNRSFDFYLLCLKNMLLQD